MDVYDAIRSRVSVRSFKPDPVPDAVLDKILRAARWAPSRRNNQPWRLIVIKNKDTLSKLAGLTSGGSYVADAPMAIAVAMDDKRMAQFDAGRLIENMLLVAWSEGIGTCMVGGWDQDAVKELLGIPQDMEFITAMPYGYPVDSAPSSKRRKPLSEFVHIERFSD